MERSKRWKYIIFLLVPFIIIWIIIFRAKIIEGYGYGIGHGIGRGGGIGHGIRGFGRGYGGFGRGYGRYSNWIGGTYEVNPIYFDQNIM